MSNTRRVLAVFDDEADAELFVENLTMFMGAHYYVEQIMEDINCNGGSVDDNIEHIMRACRMANEYYPGRVTFFETVDYIDSLSVAYTIGYE